MDFTLKTYIHLLQTLKSRNYTFLPFSNYIQLHQKSTSPLLPLSTSSSACVVRSPLRRTKSEAFSTAVALAKAVAKKDRLPLIILRHDVDKLPGNALRVAQIEHKLGIKGTYYFRIVPESFEPDIIKKIAALGHEIGYHYEDVVLASKKIKVKSKKYLNKDELFKEVIESFLKNLETLRKIAPVKTICMHGSPLSKFANKLLWKYYNYKDFGIIGEPYFDVDFSKVLYLTDTGRRWNGERVSVRDKEFNHKGKKLLSEKYNFRTTFNIIKAAEKGELPEQIMFTFHPQRWSDKFGPWVKELVWQNVKNVGKYFIIRIRK